MKTDVHLYLDLELQREIERLRGEEKRSVFIKQLLTLGIAEYRSKNKK